MIFNRRSSKQNTVKYEIGARERQEVFKEHIDTFVNEDPSNQLLGDLMIDLFQQNELLLAKMEMQYTK